MPAAAGLFVLVEPILQLWVGDRMTDPETQLPLAVVLIRIMTVGMVIRALTDGWIKILYGAGHVTKYAPIILGGVIANPILAVMLYFILPEPYQFIFAVTSYSIVYVIFNIGILPRLMGKVLDMPVSSILLPIVKPLFVTLISMGALVYMCTFIEVWNGWNFLSICAIYGGLYVLLLVPIVLNGKERALILNALKK